MLGRRRWKRGTGKRETDKVWKALHNLSEVTMLSVNQKRRRKSTVSKSSRAEIKKVSGGMVALLKSIKAVRHRQVVLEQQCCDVLCSQFTDKLTWMNLALPILCVLYLYAVCYLIMLLADSYTTSGHSFLKYKLGSNCSDRSYSQVHWLPNRRISHWRSPVSTRRLTLSLSLCSKTFYSDFAIPCCSRCLQSVILWIFHGS